MNQNAAREFPRQFVPTDCDFGVWDQIEPMMKDLTERGIASKDGLERWLLDQSELIACLNEEKAMRYIRMTCNTEDEEIEKAYLHYIENIQPQLMPYFHKMNEKLVACPHKNELNRERYEVMLRNVEAEIEIFREENIPLQTECSKLSQQYQKIIGAMMVEFEGKEQTLPQMAKYFEETDRERRQAAWEAVMHRRKQDRDPCDEIYEQLIEKRHQIAQNANCENFRDFAFKMYKRFDYTPEDCRRFHIAVEKCVVPLARDIAEQRRQTLGLDALRPWDMQVDPKNRPPLRPFETAEQLCDGVERIFTHLDAELADQFTSMRQNNELDLDSRKGKAPGGYLYCRDERRRPFIFMNAAGVHRDVETLLHESGHAFHSLACRNEPLVDYRDSPIEFAEVASMSMELFADDLLNEFYSEGEAARAKRKHLEGIINILPWIACIDDYQHWVYTHPAHTRAERTAYWLELDDKYGVKADWSGFEEFREFQWQRQLHLFVHPFYYIEYGIAQLGALQLWCRFQEDPLSTLESYRAGLALGGSKPLPILFETAGAHFDFSEQTIQPLIETVDKELSEIPA